MWRLLYFSCLLLAFGIRTTKQELIHLDDDHVYVEESKDFWKVVFNTYYSLRGLRNETTDKLVESFFEHKFDAYPKELYPAFEKIFAHISKSNDRIWNFYESILYFYHNVEAADRVYETVLGRVALGKLLNESVELDTAALFPLEEITKAELENLEHRIGATLEDDSVSEFEDQPCQDECGVPPLQVGSVRAIPGEHFPNYEEIPITTFTCAGKHIPGFYADLETGCQVFHVCYSHRRESFLCPIGTIFNQAILACDYWYSSNCSLAPIYFPSSENEDEPITATTESFVDHLLGEYETPEISVEAKPHPADSKKIGKPKSPKIKITLPNIDWTLMIKFLPIKSKIAEFPDVCHTSTTTKPTTTSKYEESTVMSTTPLATTTTAQHIKPTTTSKYEGSTTSTRPTVGTVPPKKGYDKAVKSEMLLNILKAVETLTKDAEGVLSKLLEKSKQDLTIKKPTVVHPIATEKPKTVPEINPRFVVKPVKIVKNLPRPKVTPRKPLKASKQIVKSKMDALLLKKAPAKLVLEGMKAFAHLFE